MWSGWDRVSSIGQRQDDPPSERRRVQLTNLGAFLGAVTCTVFVAAYALAGSKFLVPMVSNATAVLCLLLALALSRRGARALAKTVLLVSVNVDVVVASMWVGHQAGYLYYFFVFTIVAFLVFDERYRAHRWLLALLSVASCVFVQVVAPEKALLSLAVARVVDVVSALAAMGTAVIVVETFARDTARAEARLAEEHARSERLLLNILPASISQRLKDDGGAIADRFEEVTVLFADIVGFTELSQRLSADELVRMLNRIFSQFDDLAEERGLEKIKTIGDCYMVAAGLPEPRPDHTESIARMALGMRDVLVRVNAESGYTLQIRIGIHTGAVVAGVIGKRKFVYDLWGDTVNTASRMESSGLPGEIQVTRDAFDRLKATFDLEPRGTIKVKGMGEMETFLLKRPL